MSIIHAIQGFYVTLWDGIAAAAATPAGWVAAAVVLLAAGLLVARYALRRRTLTTFYMTVRNTDGTVTEGACSDADVMRSLATAARRGYQVEVTQQGGANITRTVPGKGSHTVVYAPMRIVGHLTPSAREDLRLIAIRPAAGFQPETGRIKAGYVNSIPPAASALLLSRGLVTVDGTTATLSMSARLVMLALAHRQPPWAYILTTAELAGFCGEVLK